MDRPIDTVEFYITTTTKHVVDINAFAAAVAEQGDGWAARAREAVKQEIPEDRPGRQLTAVALFAEGEFITEYDPNSKYHVTEQDDRDAIVIGAMAVGVDLPERFAAPGVDPASAAAGMLFV